MNKMITQAKQAIRKTSLYLPLLWWRAHKQETAYVQISQKATRAFPKTLTSSGWEECSRALLSERWQHNKRPITDISQVRIFIVDNTQMSPWWLQDEVRRNMNAFVFSLYRHKEGYQKGVPGLVSYSTTDLGQGWPLPLTGKAFTAWRTQLQSDLLVTARTAHDEQPLDLCFVYAPADIVLPSTLAQLRGLGAPVCSWWLDEKHVFGTHVGQKGQGAIAEECDLHLTNTLEATRWYLARGEPAYYFPQAVDVSGVTVPEKQKDIPVSFIGEAYGWRGAFIRKLQQLGVPITCYGKGWENGRVQNALDIYARSVINLGIGYTGMSSRMTCLKGRDFSVLGSGGFYLTTYDAELARLFTISREIMCYRNEIDCAEIIRYYLERPEEAEAIGAAARQRCLREHTWTKRFAQLLRWMGILQDQL